MTLFALAVEFAEMNNLAEGCGLVLECRTVSIGACKWMPLFTIKKDGEVVFETAEKWRAKDYLVALDFLTDLVKSNTLPASVN